jgi:selenocysteine lyase/cysteine desulfurase
LVESLDNLSGLQRTLVLVTTDADYPSVGDYLMKGLQSRYPLNVERVKIHEAIWNGESAERIVETIVNFCRDKKPDIICLGHVSYTCGFVIDVKTVIDKVRPSTPNAIFVIDGAQAFGNIEVSKHLFDSAEYYAGCVHKWLLVRQNLGFLIRNEGLLKSKEFAFSFKGVTRPFSTYPIAEDPVSFTISLEPYFGANGILKDEWLRLGQQKIHEHNQKLAKIFRSELLSLGINVSTGPETGSIVSFGLDGSTANLYIGLNRRGYKCSLLDLKFLERSVRALRFCFHYYHNESDVLELLNAIEDEKNRIERLA